MFPNSGADLEHAGGQGQVPVHLPTFDWVHVNAAQWWDVVLEVSHGQYHLRVTASWDKPMPPNLRTHERSRSTGAKQ